MEEKSANKRWKESGTTLSFKEYIQRENEKKEAPILSLDGMGIQNSLPIVDTTAMQNQLQSDSEAIINETIQQSQAQYPQYVNPAVANNKTLGLNTNVLIFSGVLIASSIGFYLYKKYKK